MPKRLPDIPAGSTIRQNRDGSWQYQQRSVGPWLPMPAPQGAAPWADGPAPATITPADRLALAVCVAALPGSKPCNAPCNACRVNSAAVAHEIARQFRERHGGSSQVADWLDGVGCHAPGAGQSVHP